MYHIFLCEDHESFLKYLRRVILQTGLAEDKVRFYEFASGEALVSCLSEPDLRCDLLILDMQLPGMSGDEVAECFRRRFPDTLLVFCSGTTRPTDRSFKAMAYRYLYKEYTDEKMLAEMREIVDKMSAHKAAPVLIAHNYYKQVRLGLDEILYIQLAKRGSRIIVCPNVDLGDVTGDLLIHEKLSDLYESLKDFGFAYAHNSYIVNLRYVKKIVENELEFVKWENEEKAQRLNVSRTRSRELKRIFALEMGNKYESR